jgi:hypothetical protein
VLADAKKIRRDGAAEIMQAYGQTLAELLWFDLYFEADRVSGDEVEALKLLLGEDDPAVVRTEGLRLLAGGNPDEARVKLSAVADRDVPARLTLLKKDLADETRAEAARAELQSLANRCPPGIHGAYAAVLTQQNQVVPVVADADKPIQAAGAESYELASKFLGSTRSFYLLIAEPRQAAFEFGEPMLVDLTLKNVGSIPVTIGNGGMVRPFVLFDASVRTAKPQMLTGVALAQLSSRVRLNPRESITQTVRIDRARLNQVLRLYPTPPIPLAVTVTTNPVPTERGSIAAPGGIQTQVGRVMERRAAPLQLPAYREQILKRLEQGKPAERLQAAEFLATVLPGITNEGNPAEVIEAGRKMIDAVASHGEAETEPIIRAWTSVIQAMATEDESKARDAVRALALSEDEIVKMSGLLFARLLNEEDRKAVTQAAIDAGAAGTTLEMATAVRDMPEPVRPTTTPAETPAN